MKITLTPQVSDKTLVVTKKEDTLTINGVSFDFTQIPEGGHLPSDAVPSEFVVGTLSRISGELNLTLLIPISVDAPLSATFPGPLVNPPDGKLKFPEGVNV